MDIDQKYKGFFYYRYADDLVLGVKGDTLDDDLKELGFSTKTEYLECGQSGLHLGLELRLVAPGRVEVNLPHSRITRRWKAKYSDTKLGNEHFLGLLRHCNQLLTSNLILVGAYRLIQSARP